MAPSSDKEMNMNTTPKHTVSRVLLVSPPQNEMIRRNFSRIFIAPVGEGAIDSILFQGYRPIEGFAEVAARAIQMAALHDATGSLALKPQVNPAFTGGFLQQHLVSTGWLENKDNTVYDVWVEVLIENENLAEVDMKTYNGVPIDGFSENPLIVAVDVAELAPKNILDTGLDEEQVEEPIIELPINQGPTAPNLVRKAPRRMAMATMSRPVGRGG
jgi:hypothetical protein